MSGNAWPRPAVNLVCRWLTSKCLPNTENWSSVARTSGHCSYGGDGGGDARRQGSKRDG